MSPEELKTAEMINKPTVAPNRDVHDAKLKEWGWDCKNPKGWYRLVESDRMSSKSDVVLLRDSWQYVDGLDFAQVGGREVWRSEKLSGESTENYLEKHAERLKAIERERQEEEERKKKEAAILTKVSKVDDENIVEFSPLMETFIRDFGCHETKVRNLMERLFIEVEEMKK